jgi:spore photoproduct lyase
MKSSKYDFEKKILNTLFNVLDKNLQNFLKQEASKYRFSHNDLKQLIDIAIDLNMWQEDNLDKIWLATDDKKKL